MLVGLQVDERIYAKVEQLAAAAGRPVGDQLALLVQLAADLRLGKERAVVIAGADLEKLEAMLGGGSVLHSADLVKKVDRLAAVSFRHVRLPFTPNQLEALAEKAKRQGLTVEQLVERTAPRMYEQFFDLIPVGLG